jgi:ATP-dependent protease ClpP protease subunit
MEEQDFMEMSRNILIAGRPNGMTYKIYLCGNIKDPEDYVDAFESIRNAGERDEIYIHINSEGGNLFTAIQFLRVIGETKGTVIASVEGLCMSAATLIFMAAKHHEITNHSIFMFHNYSNKIEGKGHELYDHIVHVREWGEKMIRDVYSGFLAEDEIKIVLDGKDLYMTSEEVASRLEKRNIQIVKVAEQLVKDGERKVKKPRKARKVLITHRDEVTV